MSSWMKGSCWTNVSGRPHGAGHRHFEGASWPLKGAPSADTVWREVSLHGSWPRVVLFFVTHLGPCFIGSAIEVVLLQR